MKKILLATTAFAALAATSAQAAVNVGIDIGAPGYYAPTPVYYAPPPAPVYYPWGMERHRDYNWGYWNHPGPAQGRDDRDHDQQDHDHWGR